MSERLDTLTERLDTLESKTKKALILSENNKEKQDIQQQEIETNKIEQQKQHQEINVLKSILQEQTNRSLRSTLFFRNVAEEKNEKSWDDTTKLLVSHLSKTGMKVDYIRI